MKGPFSPLLSSGWVGKTGFLREGQGMPSSIEGYCNQRRTVHHNSQLENLIKLFYCGLLSLALG